MIAAALLRGLALAVLLLAVAAMWIDS